MPFSTLHRHSGKRTLALGRHFSGFDAMNMGAAMTMVVLWLGSLWYGERGDCTGTEGKNDVCEGNCLLYEIIVPSIPNHPPSAASS